MHCSFVTLIQTDLQRLLKSTVLVWKIVLEEERKSGSRLVKSGAISLKMVQF